MQYLLIKLDGDKFFYHEVDPDKFMAELRRALGDAKLEQITSTFGGMGYDYLVIGGETRLQATGLRPKLLSVQGIAEVLNFDTRPAVE